MSMIAPHPDCGTLYDEYTNTRGGLLALFPADIVSIDASTSDQPCNTFALNKNFGDIKTIYDDGGEFEAR